MIGGYILYTESELLPISAIQHFAFCRRQCALIHIDQLWSENQLTAEGRILHEKTDTSPSQTRADIHIARHVPIRSLHLGLSGIADVIEYHKVDFETPGIELSSKKGRWTPYPIEYKRGRPKKNRCDEMQLCAQVLCLEEMHALSISQGSLFYGAVRKRKIISMDESLRRETIQTTHKLREMVDSTKLPGADPGAKCRNCSLQDLCLPDVIARKNQGSRYWSQFHTREQN